LAGAVLAIALVHKQAHAQDETPLFHTEIKEVIEDELQRKQAAK
jgi:hypothetical protein